MCMPPSQHALKAASIKGREAQRACVSHGNRWRRAQTVMPCDLPLETMVGQADLRALAQPCDGLLYVGRVKPLEVRRFWMWIGTGCTTGADVGADDPQP